VKRSFFFGFGNSLGYYRFSLVLMELPSRALKFEFFMVVLMNNPQIPAVSIAIYSPSSSEIAPVQPLQNPNPSQ
jgi:hypothetical protein